MSKTGHPDVPAQSLRIMCDVLARLGRPAPALLADCGIAAQTVDAPGARIEAQREFAFQRLFMQATSDAPGAWLDTGRQYRLMSFGEFGLAMLAASSMRAAVQFAIEHAALAFTQCRFAWAGHTPAARSGLAILTDDVDPDMRDFSVERDLGAIRTMVDDMWQGHFPLSGIDLARHDTAQHAYFERELRAPVRFGATANVVYFADRLLDQRLPLCDPLLGSTYAQRCGARLRVRGDRCADAVADVVALLQTAHGVWPDIGATARWLQCSERSLRRYLRQAGTSFRQLQCRVREQRARDMLQAGDLAVERIAEDLGYCEAASFSHAFRRWTGVSPLAFRRGQRPTMAID